MDWADIGLHAIGGFVLAAALLLVCEPWNAFVMNLLFWAAREVWQDLAKGHRWPVWPVRRSTQKDAEVIAPAVVGGLVAWLV